MSMKNQEECSFSELELFKCPAVQIDILNGKFEKIYPINKSEDSGLIEFPIEIPDLKQNYLNIKLRW